MRRGCRYRKTGKQQNKTEIAGTIDINAENNWLEGRQKWPVKR
jgi:hypothetical protein